MLVLVLLSMVAIYPGFLSAFIAWKVYENQPNPYLKWPVIAVVLLIGFALQMTWLWYLKNTFYPDVDFEELGDVEVQS